MPEPDVAVLAADAVTVPSVALQGAVVVVTGSVVSGVELVTNEMGADPLVPSA